MNVSLCMIVKNEEALLELCLKSIASMVDEIVIVDTGSIDRTKEIAFRYTDKVYDFIWVNDFAAARNYSLSKASNEYILVLDSDEIVEEIDMDAIKELVHRHPDKIGRLLRINEFRRKENKYKYSERVNRLFSKYYYKYEGTIHEQIIPIRECIPAEITETYLIPMTIRHSGYEGDLQIRKRKTERNISLLKAAQERNTDDPYILYQLGKSYYMEEDYGKACEYFGQALYFDLDPRLEYVQDMVESYGYSLINSEQYDTALQLLNVYEEFSRSADFIFLVALILMNHGSFTEAVQEFEKAASFSEAKMEGVNGYLAFYNIGVIYECLGEFGKAKQSYLSCGDYLPAKNRLNQMLKNQS